MRKLSQTNRVVAQCVGALYVGGRLEGWMKQLAKPAPCLVKLRFRVARGAVQHSSDFAVLVTSHIVQNECSPKAARKLPKCGVQVDTIDGSFELKVLASELCFNRPFLPAISFR